MKSLVQLLELPPILLSLILEWLDTNSKWCCVFLALQWFFSTTLDWEPAMLRGWLGCQIEFPPIPYIQVVQDAFCAAVNSHYIVLRIAIGHQPASTRQANSFAIWSYISPDSNAHTICRFLATYKPARGFFPKFSHVDFCSLSVRNRYIASPSKTDNKPWYAYQRWNTVLLNV